MSDLWTQPEGDESADRLDKFMAEIMAKYEYGTPRASIDAVYELKRRCLADSPGVCVTVVGTNGKSSVTYYLGKLLTESGVVCGTYSSPHLVRWSERVMVDGEPVSDDFLTRELARVDEVAGEVGRGELRFFDCLTIAAARIFAAEGCGAAVFEAGIGGRLDAVATLAAGLTVLTSIGDDHADLLGDSPEQRLFEKAMAAPRGSVLVHGLEGTALASELERLAAERSLTLIGIERRPSETNREFNFRLAATAAEALGRFGLAVRAADRPEEDLASVPGRFEKGELRGVPYIADVAHNPSAWTQLLAELSAREHTLVSAISWPRSPAAFARILDEHSAKIGEAIITEAPIRRCVEPAEIAAALAASDFEVKVVDDPPAAFEQAFSSGRPVVVFGSNYLLPAFYEFLATRPAGP